MQSMARCEHEDFFESDEAPEVVAAAFEGGVKGVTAPRVLRSGPVVRTQFGVVHVSYGVGAADTQRRGPGAHISSSSNVREPVHTG